MKLKFLGIGAGFYPTYYNTSAYFIVDNNLILIDCGETVYKRLLDSIDIHSVDNIYVLITHLHADHVGSLPSLISYCACVVNKKIQVLHSEETICELLRLTGIKESFYTHHKQFEHTIKGVTIKPVRVKHAKDMKCFGYEIITEDDHIYYSGDSSSISEDILEKYLNGQIKRIYQDTSSSISNSSSHMYVGFLEEIIPKEFRKNVFCMHLDKDYKEELRQKGFSVCEF